MYQLIVAVLFSCAISQSVSILEDFNVANRLFTSSVYKELSKSDSKNLFFSPLSAEIVLALLQTGAKNETAAEIQSVLHLPNSAIEVTNTIKQVLQSVKSGSSYTLRTANKIYIKKGLQVKNDFKKTAQNDYQAGLENINFIQSTKAAKTINRWVEKQTESKIKNLIDPKSLDRDTRAILVNALYFKGTWKYPFHNLATKKRKFYRTKNDIIEVDTMGFAFPDDTFNYGENTELDAKVLEVPILEDAALVIILPNQKDGIKILENNINKVLEPQILEQKYVTIMLPKFRLETETKLKDILQTLGISKAFSPGLADLSGFAGTKGQLYVSKVVQKAFIDVNEAGLEAAAATYGGISTYAMLPTPTHTFIAEHPFIFYIKVKEVIIFVGKVVDPTS